MTRTIDTVDDLGAIVSAEVDANPDGCEVSVADLEALGLGPQTLAYADWLHRWKLRMLRPRKGLVCLVRMPELPPDIRAALEKI